MNLFIWLYWVLVVACGIFHCGTLTLKLYLVVESWFPDQESNQHSLHWKVDSFFFFSPQCRKPFIYRQAHYIFDPYDIVTSILGMKRLRFMKVYRYNSMHMLTNFTLTSRHKLWPNCDQTPNCCSVTQSCPTLCNLMECSTPGFPVLH